MSRILSKMIDYYCLFVLIIVFGLSKGQLWYWNAIALSVILAGFNTILRPILTLLAIPFNLITVGIASLFVNLLTLSISNAIMGHLLQWNFWAMLLLAGCIMYMDVIVYRGKLLQRTKHLTR